jgi:hypothetical protein
MNDIIERRQRGPRRRPSGACVAALVALAAVCVPSAMARASDTSWYINFQTYVGYLGGVPTDLSLIMGVRPGALDGYEAFDWPKPPPPPGPPYVYSCWYRAGWLPTPTFGGDWREAFDPYESQTWANLRLRASSPGDLILVWTNLLSDWGPPRDYVVTLYDEGTSPNPTGGIAYDLFAPYPRFLDLPVAAGQTRYLHVKVRHQDAPDHQFLLEGNCWHMITVPGYPVNPWPEVVFYPTNINMTLFRYDHQIEGYVSYEVNRPSPFGQIVTGDGYWIWLFEDILVDYPAYATTGPVTLYFPTSGWYMIGSPHFGDVPLTSCQVYHATEGPVPWEDAANVWLQDPLIYYSCPRSSYLLCSMYPQGDDHELREFQGYWLYTFVDDVTLEIPPP